MLDPLPAGEKERSVSKRSVSRRFVALSQRQMTAWLCEPLTDVDVRVVMIDGIAFQDHAILITLGIDFSENKRIASVKRVLDDAWGSSGATLAHRRLEKLASSLEVENHGAAAAIREALEETLTLQRVGIGGALYRTLRRMKPIENFWIEKIAATTLGETAGDLVSMTPNVGHGLRRCLTGFR